MTDLTPAFDGFLQQHGAAPTKRGFSVEKLDGFLQEAYKINDHIVSLHAELRSIRQSYLSTAQPRKTQLRALQQKERQAQPLTDREREKIDADAKQMLRTLNASIKQLEDSERVRHETATALISKKYGGGLRALRGWVADSGPLSKAPEHTAAEETEKTVCTHRESVLWLLRQRLQACVQTQQGMMEKRISREMEKSRSLLAKAKGSDVAALRALLEPDGGAPPAGTVKGGGGGSSIPGLPPDDGQPAYNPAQDLTPEQIQMFEKDNQDMLKHYESTLDQVRTAQKSLVEISELQTQLVDNLATQSEHIEQLVADSFNTTENVGGGNKQLKKATQKPSTAKYTFYATCSLCAFLVVWDLVI